MVVTVDNALPPGPDLTAGRQEYRLVWPASSAVLPGLVAVFIPATAGGVLDATQADAAIAEHGPLTEEAVRGNADLADALYRLFRAAARSLRDWNLTDAGTPVPATLDGLLGLDLDDATAITFAWLDQVAKRTRDELVEQRAAETELGLADMPVEPLPAEHAAVAG